MSRLWTRFSSSDWRLPLPKISRIYSGCFLWNSANDLIVIEWFFWSSSRPAVTIAFLLSPEYGSGSSLDIGFKMIFEFAWRHLGIKLAWLFVWNTIASDLRYNMFLMNGRVLLPGKSYLGSFRTETITLFGSPIVAISVYMFWCGKNEITVALGRSETKRRISLTWSSGLSEASANSEHTSTPSGTSYSITLLLVKK